MEITYRKNLHKSYMCIKDQGKPVEKYEQQMLEKLEIPYLLKMETIVAEGEKEYLYDISGKQQLKDYLSGKKMDYGILWKLLFSIRELCHVLSDYLLREEGIYLESEFIYVSLEDGSLCFVYLPFWNQNLTEAFERYMEQVLRKIDHQDPAATELGYQVYQMCMMENANIQGILEGAIKKDEQPMEAGMEPKEQMEMEEGEPGFENVQAEDAEKLSWGNKKIWNKLSDGHKFLPEKALWLSKFLDGLKEGGCKKGKPGRADVEEKALKEKVLKEKALKERELKEKVLKEKGSWKKYLSGMLKKEITVRREFMEKVPEKKREGKGGSKKRDIWEENDREVTNSLSGEKEKSTAERESVHPTEVLGVNIQEPVGKLIYQGMHGCEDILVEGDEFFLGKNRGQAGGIIEAEGISRLHARISRQEGAYYLEDLNSTNGTYLNGEPVEYHQKKKLSKGDCIRFGAEEFVFS